MFHNYRQSVDVIYILAEIFHWRPLGANALNGIVLFNVYKLQDR